MSLFYTSRELSHLNYTLLFRKDYTERLITWTATCSFHGRPGKCKGLDASPGLKCWQTIHATFKIRSRCQVIYLGPNLSKLQLLSSWNFYKNTLNIFFYGFPVSSFKFHTLLFSLKMLNSILQSLVLVHLQLLASSAKYISGIFRLGAQCNGHNESKRRSRAASCKLPNSSYQANYCLG